MQNEIIEIDKEQMAAVCETEKAAVIDVREKEEFADYNIGGINIPAHELNEYIGMLGTFQKLIVICSNGTRSAIVARVMKKKLPESQIYHLSAGIF